MKVSVIIPTYNRGGDFLPNAVASVLGQDYPNLELIIVDDGSTDCTSSYLSSLPGSVLTFKQDNRGPAAARNLGISHASGEFIAFLDSDDFWQDNKLTKQVAAMVARPDIFVSHTDEVWFRRGEFLNQKKIHARPAGNIFASCLKICCVGMSTALVRPKFFHEVGLFDEDLPCCEDYDLWLRASLLLDFLKIDSPLTIKQGGRPDQVSQQYQVGMDRFRIRALQKILAGGLATIEQEQLVLAQLIKKCRIYGNGCLKHGKKKEGSKYLLFLQKYESALETAQCK